MPKSPQMLVILAMICCTLHQSRALTTLFDPDEDKSVQLFEEEDQEGDSITLYWHSAELTRDWSSLTQSGVWIYYSDTNFQGKNVTAVFGEDVSINIFHPVKSLRYAGSSQSSTQSTVVLYRDTWFRGQEHYVEVVDGGELVMVPNFRDMGIDARSMIVVGEKFTVFPEQNFFGPCLCLQPTHFQMTFGDDGPEMLMASFYPDLGEIGSVGSLIMTCENAPMKKHCTSLPDEETNRSRCPVLTNGRIQYCGR